MMLAPVFSSPSSCLGELIDSWDAADEGDAAAGKNAFFNSSCCRMLSIVDAVFFLFHFDFCCSTDADHRHAAGKFC